MLYTDTKDHKANQRRKNHRKMKDPYVRAQYTVHTHMHNKQCVTYIKLENKLEICFKTIVTEFAEIKCHFVGKKSVSYSN